MQNDLYKIRHAVSSFHTTRKQVMVQLTTKLYQSSSGSKHRHEPYPHHLLFRCFYVAFIT